MQKRRSYGLAFLALLLTLLVASACGGTTGGSNLSAGDVLNKSIDAMKKVSSFHINLTTNVQASGLTTTTPTTDNKNAQTPSSINFSITGSGDQQLPDQSSMNLTISALGQSTTLSEVTTGGKVYVKTPQGAWYSVDASAYKNALGNPLSGVNIDQNSLLGIIQHAQLTDHNDESLNGMSNVRHLSATLDKDALKQIFSENPQLVSALGQQNIDTVLNNTKKFDSTVDVWIDETNFYLQKTKFALNLNADTSSVGNGAPSNVTVVFNTEVNLSQFNKAVTVTAPTDATPIADPSSLFGGQQP